LNVRYWQRPDAGGDQPLAYYGGNNQGTRSIKADIEGVIAEGVNRTIAPNRAQYEATIKAQDTLPAAERDQQKLDSAKSALKLIEKYAQAPVMQLTTAQEVPNLTPICPTPSSRPSSSLSSARPPPGRSGWVHTCPSPSIRRSGYELRHREGG